jgi:hypothetical protein
MVPLIF